MPDHNILEFDCGDKDLNEFLLEDSKRYQQQLLAVTYIFESNSHTVAFFSMFNDKITTSEFDSKSKWKKLAPFEKRKQSYPAVKLGRLGIHVDYQKMGLGRDILNYIKILFVTSNKTGCKFLTVDAYSKSLEFYIKNGFIFMTKSDENHDTRLMYYDLMQVL